MSTLKFEAWTYPGSASYEKLFEFSPAGGSGERELSDYSDEQITVPADFPRLAQIISNRATVKILYGETVIDEFLAERDRRNLDRPGFIDISGKQRNGWIEGVGVYPKQDIAGAQDWHWGSEDNRIDNPSGEDQPVGVPNQGFEDGTLTGWRAGATPGVSATLAIETTTVDTGSFAAKCTVLLAEGGVTSDPIPLYPANFYTVTVRFQGVAAADYQFAATGPETIHGVAGSTTVVEIDGFGYEAQHTHTASGVYELVSFIFGTAGDQTSTQINIRAVGTDDFFFDVVDISGFGIGAEPWQATKPNQPGIPGVSVLEPSQDVSHPDTTWVLKCTAPHLEGVYQGFIGNIPGEIVTFSVDVRGAAAHVWTVGLRDINGNHIGNDQVINPLPTGSFTTVTGTVTLPDFLPGADQEVRLQLTNHSGGASTIYWAKASVAPGAPTATFTRIVRELLEDAQARGTATWLELDADDTQDTLGTALSTVSFSAFTGDNAHMGHVMRDGRDIGYHWRIEDAANAQIITPTGSHVLQIFYTTTGEIEDKTTVAGGDYVFAGVVSDGEVVDRIPPFTALLALGEGGAKLEDTATAEIAAIGRIERVRDVEHLPESSLQLYLDTAFAEEAKNRKAVRATLLGTARKIPGVDFGEGSKVWWQLGDLLPREARAVRRWTWTHGATARFEVQGSRVLTKEAALAKALDHLLNVLERRAVRGRTNRAGSPIPVSVTSDQPGEFINAVRDFQANGDGTTDTTAELQNAIDIAESRIVAGLRTVTIYIPAGTYITEPLYVEQSGIRLLLDPETTLRLKAGTYNAPVQGLSTGVVNFYGQSGSRLSRVAIEGGTVDGNKANVTNTGDEFDLECVSFEYCDESWARDVKAINGYADGFDLDECADVYLIHCWAEDCGGWGFHPSINSTRIRLIDCDAVNCGDDRTRGGFNQFVSATDCTFLRCRAVDCYQNFDIDGSGAHVGMLRSEGTTTVADDFSGVALNLDTGGGGSLGALSDVDLTGLLSGDLIRYNGTAFVPAAPAGIGRYEVIVSGTAPPVAATNEAEDDWVYGFVS